MNALFWNIMLALAWVAMNGDFTLQNFLVGFMLGIVVLFFARRSRESTNYVRKVWRVLELLAFFIKELIRANLRVAYEVLTPTHYMQPGFIQIPLDARTDVEITLLANLITLTPGTLSLDVSADRRVLYLHAMYVDDPEKLRTEIKNGFERRVLRVLR